MSELRSLSPSLGGIEEERVFRYLKRENGLTLVVQVDQNVAARQLPRCFSWFARRLLGGGRCAVPYRCGLSRTPARFIERALLRTLALSEEDMQRANGAPSSPCAPLAAACGGEGSHSVGREASLAREEEWGGCGFLHG